MDYQTNLFLIDQTNWFEANEICHSLNMRLATINSQEENDALGRFIRSTDKFSEEFCAFWIGASDLAREGSFVWMGTGKPVAYSNWRSSEPNDGNGNEDCVVIAYRPSVKYWWNWNDFNCSEGISFICERIENECIIIF